MHLTKNMKKFKHGLTFYTVLIEKRGGRSVALLSRHYAHGRLKITESVKGDFYRLFVPIGLAQIRSTCHRTGYSEPKNKFRLLPLFSADLADSQLTGSPDRNYWVFFSKRKAIAFAKMVDSGCLPNGCLPYDRKYTPN